MVGPTTTHHAPTMSSSSQNHVCVPIVHQHIGQRARTRAEAITLLQKWLNQRLHYVTNQGALDDVYKTVCLALVDIDYHYPSQAERHRSPISVATDALRLFDVATETGNYEENLKFLASDDDEDDGEEEGSEEEAEDDSVEDDDEDKDGDVGGIFSDDD